MKYQYRKGTIERDLVLTIMLYITIASLVMVAVSALQIYILQGQLDNEVCNVN